MPKIDNINVPKELWQELIRAEAQHITADFLERIPSYSRIDDTAQWSQLESVKERLDTVRSRVMELIKVQTGLDETNARPQPNFDKVMSAAADFVDQLVFDTLFDLDHLKSAIEKKLKAYSPPSLPLD